MPGGTPTHRSGGQIHYWIRILALLLVAVLATALLAPWLLEQLAIDRCLDAGGAFDYRNRHCRGISEQPEE